MKPDVYVVSCDYCEGISGHSVFSVHETEEEAVEMMKRLEEHGCSEDVNYYVTSHKITRGAKNG